MNEKDFLVQIIRGANEGTRNGYVITLCVHGIIVSGKVISLESYRIKRDRLMIEIQSNISAKEKGQLWDEVESFVKSDPLPTDETQFIYLDEARLTSGSLMLEIGLWRGRFDAIDGYGFGGVVNSNETGFLPHLD